MYLEESSLFILFRTPDLSSESKHKIRILMVLIFVVILEIVERMVVPVPWFDHYTPIPFCCGFKEFLDTWRDLLMNQVV